MARKDIGKARRCGTPQSADADSSPCRGAFQAAVPQSLPCKGLRSRAPPAAEKAVSHAANGRHSFYYRLFGDRKHKTALRSPLRSLPLRGNAAVAEHKRASARAVRCGHRKPDGGCAVRRRRRGAALGRALTPAGRQGGIAAFVGDDACIVPRGLRLDDGFAPPAGKSRIVGRAISPADAGGDRRAVCGISQAIAPKGCGSQKVSGGRERPPYKLTGNVCRAFYRQPAANLSGPMKIIGPYAKARATRKEPSNTRRQCTPPASLTRCHLPLQGRLSKQQPPAKPPL